MNLLEVQNLKVHFPVKHGMFNPNRDFVKAVEGWMRYPYWKSE